jgi:hypothetical protein
LNKIKINEFLLSTVCFRGADEAAAVVVLLLILIESCLNFCSVIKMILEKNHFFSHILYLDDQRDEYLI